MSILAVNGCDNIERSRKPKEGCHVFLTRLSIGTAMCIFLCSADGVDDYLSLRREAFGFNVTARPPDGGTHHLHGPDSDYSVRSAGRVTVPGASIARRVASRMYAEGSTPASFADSMRL